MTASGLRIRRLGWGVLDQGLSSGTNFLLIVVAARTLDARSFGSFSVALAIYIIVLGSSRGLNTDALAIRFGEASRSAQRKAIGAAAGASLTSGALTGSIVVAAGLLTRGPLRESLVSLGVSLPGLMLQDAWRYALFTTRQPARATLIDFVWAGLQVLFIGGLLMRGRADVSTLVLAWGGAATIAAASGCLQLRILPRLSHVRTWWAQHSDLGPRYMLQFWALHGSSQLVVLILGSIAGLEATGALRGAQALFGPLTVLIVGLRLTLLSEGSSERDRPAQLNRLMRMASVALTTVAGAWGLTLTLLPARLGEELLGDTWDRAASVVIPVALTVMAVAATEGAVSGLRVLAAARRSLGIQLAAGLLTVLGGLFGALAAGPFGAAVGMASSGWLSAALWWRAYRKEQPSSTWPARNLEVPHLLDS